MMFDDDNATVGICDKPVEVAYDEFLRKNDIDREKVPMALLHYAFNSGWAACRDYSREHYEDDGK